MTTYEKHTCPVCDGSTFTPSGQCADCLRGAWHLGFVMATQPLTPCPVLVGLVGTIGAYKTVGGC